VDREHLKTLIEGCVHKGEVTLASGKTSDFYVDGRLVTLDCEGSRLVGEEVLDLVGELKVTAIGGPTTGACPMVSAAGVLAAEAGIPLKLFYVRAVPKGHGMQKLIEGATLDKTDRVLIVDDVITAGTAKRDAIDKIRKEGGIVAGIVVALDRMEKLPAADGDDSKPGPSAIGELRKEYGIPIFAILTLDDIIAGMQGFATPEDVQRTEEYRRKYKATD